MRLTEIADKIIGELGLNPLAVENGGLMLSQQVERTVAAIDPWDLLSFFARRDPPPSEVEQRRVVALQLMHRIRKYA